MASSAGVLGVRVVWALSKDVPFVFGSEIPPGLEGKDCVTASAAFLIVCISLDLLPAVELEQGIVN